MAANTPGPGVDALGQAVIDPTKNVLQLVEAAIQRQDDLREAEAKHIRELDAMRDAHAKEIRESESARLDAIRSVDITAVQRAAEVAATQASTLAAQVTASAEALRIALDQSTTQSRNSLSLALEPIQKDIADLRRVQYEAAGQKTQVVETRDSHGDSRGTVALVVSASLAVLTILVLILSQLHIAGH
jgi:hypothetical protein